MLNTKSKYVVCLEIGFGTRAGVQRKRGPPPKNLICVTIHSIKSRKLFDESWIELDAEIDKYEQQTAVHIL
jgi:hypothetical protein